MNSLMDYLKRVRRSEVVVIYPRLLRCIVKEQLQLFAMILFFIFPLLISFQSRAVDQCSEKIGAATLNEIYKESGNNKDNFIEIKLFELPEGFTPKSEYDDWQIKVCYGKKKGNSTTNECQTIPVEDMSDDSIWIYGLNLVSSDYLDFNNGFDLALLDSNDDFIDYIQVHDYSGQNFGPSASCDYDDLKYVYDTPDDIKGGTVLILRSPDGEGRWEQYENTNKHPITPGGGNEGDEPVADYQITVDDISVLESNQATVIVNLKTSTGAEAIAEQDIQVHFQTIDGKATAPNYYQAFDDTVTILQGESSTSVNIQTNYIGDGIETNFSVVISEVEEVPSIVIDDSAVVTITPFATVLTNYYFDECELTGQVGDVIDASDNANHGTSKNGSETGDGGAVNRFLDLRLSNSIQYVESDIDLSDDWSISSWIQLNNISSSFLGDLMPLFVKSKSQAFFRLNKAGFGGNELTWSTGSYQNEGNYDFSSFSSDEWIHIVVQATGGSTQLYVNGQLVDTINNAIDGILAKIGENTETVYFGWLPVDVDLGFENPLDEAIFFDRALSEEEITTIYQNQLQGNSFYGEPRPFSCGSTINHYQLIHNSTGLTCDAEVVTIKACSNADCSILSTEPVTVDFVVSGVDPSTQTIVDLTGQTDISYRFTDASNATIGLDTLTTVDCYSGGLSSNCQTAFNSAAFKFFADDGVSQVDNYIAGQAFNLTLKALEDDGNGVCVDSFSSNNVSVDFGVIYNNPTTPSSNEYYIGGTEIPKGQSQPNPLQGITLDFSQNNTASFSNTYFDAGNISLIAHHTDSDGFTLTGETDFWVQPQSLKVEVLNSTNQPITGQDHLSTTKHKAGADFTFQVTATNGREGEVARNYISLPRQVHLKVDLTLPENGYQGMFRYANNFSVESGTGFQQTAIIFTENERGLYQFSSGSFSEVGVIFVDIEDVNYGPSLTVPSEGLTVGRFTPDHYLQAAFDGVVHGTLTADNGFAYIGEYVPGTDLDPVGVIKYDEQPVIQLTARNAFDLPTKNYIGDFIKLTADTSYNLTFSSEDTSTGKSLALESKTNSPTALEEITGEGKIDYVFNPNDTFIYTREKNSEISAFRGEVVIEINSIIDSDDIEAKGESGSFVNPTPIGYIDTFVRFGRWRLENSFGAETAQQVIPMKIEYLTVDGYKLNTEESMQSASVCNKVMITEAGNNLIDPDDINIVVDCDDDDGIFSNGESRHLIIENSAQSRGQVGVEFTVPDWLKYNWSDTDAEPNENPSATATFGVFRGNDRIIYRREVKN